MSAAALVACGLVGAGLTAWAVATSPILTTPGADAVVRAFVVGLYMLAGVYVWRRRTGERFAVVLLAMGLLNAVTTFNTSGDATLYTLGRLYTAVYVALVYAAILSYPSGRLASRLERAIVTWYAVAALVLWTLIVALAEMLPTASVLTDCGSRCPHNAFRAATVSGSVAHVPVVLLNVLTVAVSLAVGYVLARKAWSPVGVERRTVRPILLCSAVIVASYGAFSIHPGSGTWQTLNLVATGAAVIVLPIAFVLAPVRGELFVSGSLWKGLSSLDYARFSQTHVEDIARRALGDGTLRLAVSSPGTGALHGVDGLRLAPTPAGTGSAVTWIGHAGEGNAILHHPTLANGYQSLVERVGRLAFTLIEQARPFREVVLSRRRIAETESNERTQLERDLHDGAQQRLLAIQLKLADLQRNVADSELELPVRELSRDAASAVEELRRTAQGIYPPVLLERGLADALRELPSPPAPSLAVVDNGIPRLPAATERAVYYAAVEAIQNATKHAGAREVVVVLEPVVGGVEVWVEDDGRGFDTGRDATGTGLTGIRDRIGSVGGEVEIRSAPGAGTVVRFEVPGAAGADGLPAADAPTAPEPRLPAEAAT